MRIPHSRPTLGEQEAQAAHAAVASGFVGTGPQVDAFGRLCAEHAGEESAVPTDTGSSALLLALQALEVSAGDEVIVPAFVCRAVLNVVLAARATPVLVDVEPGDFTIRTQGIERAVTSRTRAIVVAHMFGAPANIERAEAVGIPVIEDAASSIGASMRGTPVGGRGRVATFSFASTKMVTAGQGGALLTDDPDIARRAMKLLAYDSEDHDSAGAPAFNHNLADVAAGVGAVQMRRLKSFVERRRVIAGQYDEVLGSLAWLTLPSVRDGAEHSYYRYIVRVGGAAARVARDLRESGIDARTGIAHCLYDYLGQPASDFPVAESLRTSLVSLPIYPSLTDAEVTEVGERAAEALVRHAPQPA